MTIVERIVTHGKYAKTAKVCGTIIECPECRFCSVHGNYKESGKRFKVAEHTDGHPLYVVDCPNCNCCFHIDISKVRRD